MVNSQKRATEERGVGSWGFVFLFLKNEKIFVLFLWKSGSVCLLVKKKESWERIINFKEKKKK